jgi:hypothetical protein
MLRARITQTLDITTRDETSQLASDAEQILSIVREWVDAFTATMR